MGRSPNVPFYRRLMAVLRAALIILLFSASAQAATQTFVLGGTTYASDGGPVGDGTNAFTYPSGRTVYSAAATRWPPPTSPSTGTAHTARPAAKTACTVPRRARPPATTYPSSPGWCPLVAMAAQRYLKPILPASTSRSRCDRSAHTPSA